MKSPLLFLLLLASQLVMAQLGNIFYGGTDNDFISEMKPSSDGNFYAVGTKTEIFRKVWLLKLNSLGELIWEKTFTLSYPGFSEHGFSINIFPDGTLLITGEQITDGSFNDHVAIAIKTDADGNQQWKRHYQDISSLYDAKPAGNTILMGGWHDDSGSSDSGILLITDAIGVPIKRIEITIANQTFVKKIIPTSDNHFIIAGRSNVIGVGYYGIFLEKITTAGDVIWSTMEDTGFGEGDFTPNNAISPQPLGVYVDPTDAIWITNPKGTLTDISLLKFSPNGGFEGEKVYGSPELKEIPCSIIPSIGSGYIITGGTWEGKAFAMEISSTGLEKWRGYYDRGSAQMFAYDMDWNGTHYLMSGQFQDSLSPPPDYDGWLFGIEKDGNQFPFSIKGNVILDENNNCLRDPGEQSLPGWFVDITSENEFSIEKSLLMTDESGLFKLTVPASLNQITLYNSDTSKWNICSPHISFEINLAHPEDSIIFLVQSNGNCIAPEVSLTQPDFIRCDTSCLIASVKNDSPEATEPLRLVIEIDDVLHLTSCSRPFMELGNLTLIQLDPIEKYESINTELCLSLDCDVQLGATHTIKATVESLYCEPAYTGPRFTVHGYCDGDRANFAFINTGGGGKNASTTYSVYANGITITEEEEIKLPEGDPIKEISLPADGRTWLVVMKPAPDDPRQDIPSDAIEGCGKGSNGLHSIGFLNGSRANDSGPDICIVRAPNTIGVQNKISESTVGYGFYNLVNDADRMEFSLRVQNSFSEVATELTIDIKINENLDPRTFRLLSTPGDEIISFPDTSTIRLVYQDLIIQPEKIVMMRFSLQPRNGILPNTGAKSLFAIYANVYFNEKGPIELEPGFYNYSEQVPLEADLYNQYESEIKLYGGRNYDFADRIAKGKDGSVFTCGTTWSYGLRGPRDGFVLKLNSNGEVLWQAVLDAGILGGNNFTGIGPLPDGGCLVSGNYWAPLVENYVENTRIYISRLNKDGKVLWLKHLDTPPEVLGAWTFGMLETADGNFVIHGYAKNEGADQFYLKINDDGEILWSHFLNLNGSYFRPEEGVALHDGTCVFVGTNESTIIDSDVYVEKISADGEILWDTEYSSSKYIYLGDIAQSNTGDFMITGYSQWALDGTHYVQTPTFIKVSSEGTILWEKNPIIVPYDFARPYCILALPGQDFLVGGSIYADTMDHFDDMMLMKVNEEGEILWYKNYGARNVEQVEDLLHYSSNEIMLWGYNQPRPPFYDLQSIFVKTNGEGDISQVVEDVEVKNRSASFAFPNPAIQIVHIVLSPEPITAIPWELEDISGRVILSGKENSGPSISIDLHVLHPGPYFISFPGTQFPGCRIIIVQ